MNKSKSSSEKSRKNFYIISAIIMIGSGIGGVVVTRLSHLLYASGVPGNTVGYLQLFSQHATLANADWTLWIFGDLLLIVPSIAMYLALRNVNKTVALVGSAISIAYIVFDILVTEASSLKLVSLSQSYLVATGAAKASILSQATSIVNALPLMSFFSFTIGAVGWLLWCLVMPKTYFRKAAAAFGVVVNVMGFLGGVAFYVPMLGIFTIFGALGTAFWFIVLGAQMMLYNHRPTNTAVTQSAGLTPM